MTFIEDDTEGIHGIVHILRQQPRGEMFENADEWKGVCPLLTSAKNLYDSNQFDQQ